MDLHAWGRRFTGAAAAVLLIAAALGCQPEHASSPREVNPTGRVAESGEGKAVMSIDHGQEPPFYERLRQQMVDRQLEARDIREPRVLEAMRRVPRHRFVPAGLQPLAYDDSPLQIGHGQTISQPYIVGLMTQLVRPQPEDRALDVGTGSGYQAAILAELVARVDSIEIVAELATEATRRLDELGYDTVTVHHGDGFRGWRQGAPYDVIVLAAAPEEVPPALIEQLAPGGRLVLPVGGEVQDLILIEKRADGSLERTVVAPVRFVPMTGEARGD